MTGRRKSWRAGMHEQQTRRLQVQLSFPPALLMKQLKPLRKVSVRVRAERMAKACVHVCVNLWHGCSQLTGTPDQFSGAGVMASHAHVPSTGAAEHPSKADLRRFSCRRQAVKTRRERGRAADGKRDESEANRASNEVR